MRWINSLPGLIATAGLVLVPAVMPTAASAAVRDQGSVCRVRVSRTAAPGVFDIVRYEFNNGRCVCRVTTGPSSQGGSAESALAGLLLRRTCSDAPLATATGAGGGVGSGLWIGLGLAGAGGLAAALATGGSKSP